jgi:nucleoid-associated protein YgaU
MGVFDFVKSVGESIFGTAKAVQAAAKPGAPVAASTTAAPKPATPAVKVTPAAPEPDAIKTHITNLGLDFKDLEVRVEGDKVILDGAAPTDEVREKIILAAGNTLGVAQVEEAISVAAPGPASKFYTVETGDTLSKIAKEQYGNANKYAAIFEANRPMLSHPDKIYPGQVLRIPPMEDKAAA